MYRISEERPDRAYFTMMPNAIDEANLSADAFRLYMHFRRVIGDDEKNGKCWQSARTLATLCNLSRMAVTRAKQELVKQRLIRIETRKSENGKKDSHIIYLIDIWAESIAYMQDKYPAQEVALCGTDEDYSPTVSLDSPTGSLAVPPGGHKKNPLRRTLKEEDNTTPSKNSPTGSLRRRALEVDDRTLAFAINNTRKRGAKLYCNMCKAVEGMYHSCEGYRYVPFEYLAN